MSRWLKNSWEWFRHWCWKRKTVFFHGEMGPRMTGNTHWTEQLIVWLLCNLTHHLHIFLKVWKRCCQINPFFPEIHLHPTYTLDSLQPLNSVNPSCAEGDIYIKMCHKMSWEEGRRTFQECSSMKVIFHPWFRCKQVRWTWQCAFLCFPSYKTVKRSKGKKRWY